MTLTWHRAAAAGCWCH